MAHNTKNNIRVIPSTITLSDNGDTLDQVSTTVIKFTPLMSGDKMPDLCEEWIAFDLDTLTLSKPTLPIDYGHDDTDVIGSATVEITADKSLVASGTLVPFSRGDRASEIIYKLRAGVPYEASSLIDISGADVARLNERETATINNRDITGPVTIYYNTVLRGLTICPYGRDKNTAISLKKETAMAEENEREKSCENETTPAQPELEKFIEAFGLEQGVAYYREGCSLEDAQKRDYEELKKARLAAADEKREDTPAATDEDAAPENTDVSPSETPPEKKKEELKYIAEKIVSLDKKMAAITESLNTLKSLSRRGDETGVSASPPAKNSNVSAVYRQAEKIKSKIN